MPEPARSHILVVRNGQVSFDDVVAEANELQAQLERLIETSALPDYANHDAVDEFLAEPI